MSLIVRYDRGDGVRVGVLRDGAICALGLDSVAEALGLGLDRLRHAVEAATAVSAQLADVRLLAPVDTQEVWAAGVTYMRSRDARLEESHGADVYSRVYAAERPELFFKSTGARVVGPGESIGVRDDSGWNLPEAELAAVLTPAGEIAAYTAGNDVSSRDIEGENALYLPQAKVYRRSCALGPGLRPAWELDPTPVFGIGMVIRRGGAVLARGATDTSRMVRSPADLAGWLLRCLDFPQGAVLLTGTGIVPAAEVSLAAGDEVTISVSDVGTLRNDVVLVGRERPAAAAQARA